MRHIGFTGTKSGLTTAQRDALVDILYLLKRPGPTALHHGVCIGADESAASIAASLGYRVIAHPPVKEDWMSAHAFAASVESRNPLPYLQRNREIVRESAILVACPYGGKAMLRSGTWATVREALKQHRPHWIIWPSGEAEFYGEDGSFVSVTGKRMADALVSDQEVDV